MMLFLGCQLPQEIYLDHLTCPIFGTSSYERLTQVSDLATQWANRQWYGEAYLALLGPDSANDETQSNIPRKPRRLLSRGQRSQVSLRNSDL